MLRRLALVLAGLGVLTGCATTERLSAASDVHRLLVSIRDDDRAEFEAHVDRRALEAEIQAELVSRARDDRLPPAGRGLGMVLSGPLARAAGGVLIRPDVFRAVADYYGYRPDTPIPGQIGLAGALTALPDGGVCAKTRKGGPCLLTFAQEEGTWRLVAFDAHTVMAAAAGARHP